ncbi:PTK2 isoform 16, partial [Pan troglodytes]
MRLRFCISSQEYSINNAESFSASYPETYDVQGMFQLTNWTLTSEGRLDTTPVGDSFIEMAQKLLNSDLGELINKMKLAQQYVMTSLQQEYKKQMLTAAHALAVDAKNLLDVIDQARLKML